MRRLAARTAPGAEVADGAVVEAQRPETVASMKQHYDRLSREYLGPDGLLHLPVSAIIASGRPT